MPIKDGTSNWVHLCRYCGETTEQHSGRKCLFSATYYEQVSLDHLHKVLLDSLKAESRPSTLDWYNDNYISQVKWEVHPDGLVLIMFAPGQSRRRTGLLSRSVIIHADH